MYAKILVVFIGLLVIQSLALIWLIVQGVERDYALTQQHQHVESAQAIVDRFTEILEAGGSFSDIERDAQLFFYIAPRSQVLLTDDQGKILHSFLGIYGVFQDSIPVKPIEQFLAGDPFPLFLPDISHGKGDRQAIFSAAPLSFQGNKFYVVVLMPSRIFGSSLLYGNENLTLNSVLGTTLVILFSATVVGGIVFFLLTRRIRSLTVAARRYGAGDLEYRVPIAGRDEFAELGGAFNAMADEIQQRIDDVAQQDTLRRELVGALSHDLSAPAGIIINCTDILFEKADSLSTAERERYLESLSRNAQSLNILTQDLVELSRFGSLDIKLSRSEVEVGELFRDMQASFQPRAETLQVAFEIEPPQEEVYVDADPVQLERILSNLLGNALRHTKPGGTTTLGGFVEGDSFVFEVRDTGEGIKPEDIPKVFERYYQGGASSKGLSGLGLSIVRTLVEAHGSKISLRSQFGSGTCFYFSLPMVN